MGCIKIILSSWLVKSTSYGFISREKEFGLQFNDPIPIESVQTNRIQWHIWVMVWMVHSYQWLGGPSVVRWAVMQKPNCLQRIPFWLFDIIFYMRHIVPCHPFFSFSINIVPERRPGWSFWPMWRCYQVISTLFTPNFFFFFFGSFVKQIKEVLYTGSFPDTTSNTCYDSLHTKTKRTMCFNSHACHSQPVTTSFIFLFFLHQFEIVLHEFFDSVLHVLSCQYLAICFAVHERDIFVVTWRLFCSLLYQPNYIIFYKEFLGIYSKVSPNEKY